MNISLNHPINKFLIFVSLVYINLIYSSDSYEFNLYKTKKENKIIYLNIRKIDIIKKKQKLDPILSGVNFM